MDSALTPYLPHAAALLIGGLVASLGPAQWARGERGRGQLAAMSGRRWAGILASLTIVPIAAAYLTGRSLLSMMGSDLAGAPVWMLLVLGVAIGLPMSIPALATTRRVARQREASLERWKDNPPDLADREEFARDLQKMIRDLAPDRSEVTAEAAGNEGRVLRFVGDLERRSGERLTAALREDLEALGFKRVEGVESGRSWWTRVRPTRKKA